MGNKILLNSTFWDNRYLNKDIGWDIGFISTPLKNYINQIENKEIKILIPGCGNSYEAEYLFNNEFKNIFLIDFSETALAQFSNRVPNFPIENLICDDFFNHYSKYDLIIEQTFFCAIDPKLRSNYAQHCSELLSDKGKLIGLLFNDMLNNDKPPFGGSKEEYLNYFSPYFDINIMEMAYNSIIPRKNKELFIKLTKK